MTGVQTCALPIWKAFNTIHASNEKFYDEVNRVVQEEPNAALDPETLDLCLQCALRRTKTLVVIAHP